jgi:hypothetical protein
MVTVAEISMQYCLIMFVFFAFGMNVIYIQLCMRESEQAGEFGYMRIYE